MSKTSINAKLKAGQEWKEWLKAGGDKTQMKEGAATLKRWKEEDEKKLNKKS